MIEIRDNYTNKILYQLKENTYYKVDKNMYSKNKYIFVNNLRFLIVDIAYFIQTNSDNEIILQKLILYVEKV